MTEQTVQKRQRSWVESANSHPDFSLANLPLGVFSRDGSEPRGGVAIGDFIFDLRVAYEANLLDGQAQEAAKAASGSSLNRFFALGAPARQALRGALQDLLVEGSTQREHLQSMGESLLQPMDRCDMHMPALVGDYTDFYVGIHHATNVGKLFRPDNPLLPNYKYVPIGYHGRASTIDISGAMVKRPNGQTMPPGGSEPAFGPSKRLDYELELGIWIGPGNARGESIGIGEASSHVAGFCLLNDWSARDLQAWEYQPLGPFLSKSFATSVSPWVVTPEALEPFRCAQPARPEGDPQPLPYLYDEQDQQQGALNIELEVLLLTEAMRNKGLLPQSIALSSTKNMYWTVAQMITHHSVNGCSLQPGDLFGSGTLSGSSADSLGSFLEITQGGKEPLKLPSGETRTFLEDGDEIILKARCRQDGHASIGFGECRGRVVPAQGQAA